MKSKTQQEGFLLNNMKKLMYINENGFTEEQKQEILYAKTIISDELEKLKHNLEINEQVFTKVQKIINKYSKYIREEYYY